MLALAANKNDLYDKEEVEENEGISLAKELGAIFQRTSAKEATGVEESEGLLSEVLDELTDVMEEVTEEITEEFQKKYVCPNKKKPCNHFLGNVPYNILRQNTKCPYCGCGFNEK